MSIRSRLDRLDSLSLGWRPPEEAPPGLDLEAVRAASKALIEAAMGEGEPPADPGLLHLLPSVEAVRMLIRSVQDRELDAQACG